MCVEFTVKTPIFVASGLVGLATADINGDHKTDLVAVDAKNGSLMTLTGNGTGGFKLGAAIKTGLNAANAVALGKLTGKLTGSSNVDAVVLDQAANKLVVLDGNGAGGFSVAGTYTKGFSSPSVMAIGDVNGDGSQDIMVGNAKGGSVTELLNNGKGSFTRGTSIAVGGTVSGIWLTDVNGDGKLDLVTADDGNGTISVAKNLGDGKFGPETTYKVGGVPVAVIAADLTSSKLPDLVVANGDGSVSVLLNKGNGNFSAATTMQLGGIPVALAAGDINGDGKEDIVVANGSSDSVQILFGNGNGGFSSKETVQLSGAPVAVQILHLTSTATTEQIAVTLANGEVDLLQNLGTLALSAADLPNAALVQSIAAVQETHGTLASLSSSVPDPNAAHEHGLTLPIHH